MVKVIFHPDCFIHGFFPGNLHFDKLYFESLEVKKKKKKWLETSQAEASVFCILRTWALHLESHFSWKWDRIYKIEEELMPDTGETTQQGEVAQNLVNWTLGHRPSLKYVCMFYSCVFQTWRSYCPRQECGSVSWDGMVTCPRCPSLTYIRTSVSFDRLRFDGIGAR